MLLTLRAVSLNDHPLTQPITVHFDAEGGSIGRADHNTMALPDPKRHISRQQAEVKAEGAAFRVVNVGSANPIGLGQRTLARGESAALAQGDRLRIGGYLLEVEVGEAARTEATSIHRGRAAVDAATPPRPREAAALPVCDADGGAPLSPDNPFADLFGSPQAADRDPSAARPRQRLPDDFDPFATPSASPPPHRPAPSPAGVFGDLVPAAGTASIDRLFGLGGVALDGRDPLADFLAGPDAPAHADGPPLADDPLVALGLEAPPPAQGARATAADHVPALHTAFVPPRPLREPTADAPAPVDTPASTGAAAAWSAFCEGAGLALPRPQGADAETMRLVGGLLRAAVDGLVPLMAARATAKHELRAPVTVIQSQGNNPLKFSPDGAAALEQLLQPPLRGFLPGPAAVRDATNDLLGHAIGTLAGTRAALEGVLDRFSPRQLQAKLATRAVLDSVLPMNRKARLWELYLQHFETLRSEAQDDFQSLFGRAFLAAYEAQLDALRAAGPGG